jgi:uncharacterized protein YkwD
MHYLFGLFFLIVLNVSAQPWNRATLVLGDTVFMSEQEKEEGMFLNMVRTNPKAFLSCFVLPMRDAYLQRKDKGEFLDFRVRYAVLNEGEGREYDTLVSVYVGPTFLLYLNHLIARLTAMESVEALWFNGLLNGTAKAHAKWMHATGKFSHYGEGGKSPGKRIAVGGYRGGLWGENIFSSEDAFGLEVLLGYLVDEGVPDFGHRENILRPDFRHLGLGIMKNMRVQHFGGAVK